MQLGDCLIVKGFEEVRMSIAFVWPSLRVADGRGINFFIGEQVGIVALQRYGEVERLFGDVVCRMRFRLLRGGSRDGFVDIRKDSPPAS